MGGRVLIVAYEESIIASLRTALAGRPLTVVTAKDADSAITMLHKETFCGLVLDLVAEDRSAFEVMRELERTGLLVPTVVVAQRLPPEARELLSEEHVKLVLPKPVDSRLLAAIVLGLCGIAN